jgi:hypothetical protein
LHSKAARASGDPAVDRAGFSQQPLKFAHRVSLEIQFERRHGPGGAQTRRDQVSRPVEPNELGAISAMITLADGTALGGPPPLSTPSDFDNTAIVVSRRGTIVDDPRWWCR